MFMGPAAFKFYFPVVDRYLRAIRNSNEGGDCEAWILGRAILAQMEQGVDDELLTSVDQLCRYVRAHLSQYAVAPRDHKRIDRTWVLIENRVTEQRGKGQ